MSFGVCVVSKCEHVYVCEGACVSSPTTFSLKENFLLWFTFSQFGLRGTVCSLFIGYLSGVRKCALIPALWNVHFMLLLSSWGEWWHFQDENMDAAILGRCSLTPSSEEHAFFLAVSSPTPCLPSWHPPHIPVTVHGFVHIVPSSFTSGCPQTRLTRHKCYLCSVDFSDSCRY